MLLHEPNIESCGVFNPALLPGDLFVAPFEQFAEWTIRRKFRQKLSGAALPYSAFGQFFDETGIGVRLRHRRRQRPASWMSGRNSSGLLLRQPALTITVEFFTVAEDDLESGRIRGLLRGPVAQVAVHRQLVERWAKLLSDPRDLEVFADTENLTEFAVALFEAPIAARSVQPNLQ